jgi:hypothetical protein
MQYKNELIKSCIKKKKNEKIHMGGFLARLTSHYISSWKWSKLAHNWLTSCNPCVNKSMSCASNIYVKIAKKL